MPEKGKAKKAKKAKKRTKKAATKSTSAKKAASSKASTAPVSAPDCVANRGYIYQSYFDRNQKAFVAFALEFPEVKVAASNLDQAWRQLDEKLTAHFSTLKDQGRTVPPPLNEKRYPEVLEVRISQALYRRLDMLSRQERIPLDQLATEFLTQGANRRVQKEKAKEHNNNNRPRRDRENRRNQNEARFNRRNNNNNQSSGNRANGNRANGNSMSGNRGGSGNRYHDAMGDSGAFMDYVRKLEKNRSR